MQAPIDVFQAMAIYLIFLAGTVGQVWFLDEWTKSTLKQGKQTRSSWVFVSFLPFFPQKTQDQSLNTTGLAAHLNPLPFTPFVRA